MMNLTGAQIVIECLVEQSVDTIFGYPGGTVLNIYDELFQNRHRIKHILTSHEQGAAHAADGYARATGKIGVCIATSGPGATNLVTGIATAYMDSVPVVFITGNVNVDLIGKDSFQEADITGITMPITKNNYIVKNVARLANTLRMAFAIARAGRPGPVLVDIPKNVTAETTEFIPGSQLIHTQTFMKYDVKEFSDEGINKMANMRKESTQIFKSCASEEVLKLARALRAPVGVTMMGIGGFPFSLPNFTGLVGMHGTKASNTAISECGLFIALGSRFNDRVIGDASKFGSNAQVVQIDIDEAEINKNIKTAHHILGDIKQVLLRLLPLIELPADSIESREKWLQKIENLKAPQADAAGQNETDELTPKAIMSTIYKRSPQRTMIVTDVGQHQLWAAKYYQYDTPGTFISSGGFGTMGYGAGAAIGSKLGRPDMTVVHIAGDGSFRMNCNELATIEHYKLPIITVVFNNGVLGMVRQWQTMFYEKRYSQTDLDRGPDFVKLAEAYGIKGYDIRTTDEFDVAFCEALASQKPAVLNCHIGTDEKVTPMVAPGHPITDFVLYDE
jgi:acetolactate synthase-1/2/3 large subunit